MMEGEAKAPEVPLLPIWREPAEIVVLPEKVLLPERTREPVPDLVRAPLPAAMPA
ncbi:MAG: hypothetical protein N2595_01280 [bacterium]|nr:hypothetical protein [bacterium]